MPLPSEVESLFPGLSSGYVQTSEQDNRYNCIGHAAGDSDTWWQPIKHGYWPSRLSRDYTVATLKAAFATVGYSPCDSGELEPGIEKIAIFAKDGIWEHAARQLSDGRWTSKIGEQEDISHELRQLEGDEYGRVVAFVARPRR